MHQDWAFAQKGEGITVLSSHGETVVLEFNEFLRRIASGAIGPDDFIVSQVMTDGACWRVGDLKLYAQVVSGRFQTEALPRRVPDGVLTGREDAIWSEAEEDQNLGEQPRKRLVSRTEYVLRKTLAISLSVGLTACGVGGVLVLFGLPLGYFLDAEQRRPSEWCGDGPCTSVSGIFSRLALLLCLTVLPMLVTIGLPLWWGSRNSWKTVRALQPINFADTTSLPEVETLVRASDIPPSQERVELLRMAAHNTQTPPEELLRATTSAVPTAD